MAPFAGNRPDDKWYAPPLFENTDQITTLQSYYRFGFNKDFGNIFSDSRAWKNDYVYGLFAISALILCVFLGWLIFLGILKLMGSQAGCAAGIPPEPPTGGGYLRLPSTKNSTHGDADSKKRNKKSPIAAFTLLRGGSFFRYAQKGAGGDMSDSSRYSRKSSDMSSLTRGSSTKHLNETEVLLMKHIDTLDDEQESESSTKSNRNNNNGELDSHFFSENEENGGYEGGQAIRRSTIDSHFFSLPELPESVTEELSGEEDASLQKHREAGLKLQHRKRFNRIRLVFLLCGFGFILSSAFLMGNLVSLFQNSFANTQSAVDALATNLEEAESVTHEYLKIQRRAKNEVSVFSDRVLQNWCPGVDRPPIQNEIDKMNDSLVRLEDYLENETTNINKDLHGLKDLVAGSDTFFEYVRRGFDASMTASVLSVVFASLFVGGVILAWYEKATPLFSKVQTYVLLPTFVVCLTIICCCCCMFMVSALLSSDLCFKLDENVVQVIENEVRTPISNNGNELIQYYVQGCPKNNLNVELFEFDYDVQVALSSQHDFFTMLSKQKDDIRNDCEVEVGYALDQFEKVHSIFHEMLDAVYTMQNIFLCSNFNQLYVDLFHEAVCYDGINVAKRVFVLSVSVVVFGLLIVSLRVSWHQTSSNDILIEEISKPVDETIIEKVEPKNSFNSWT